MEIISRKGWGARAPRSSQTVSWRDRTGVVIHHTTGSNLGRDDSEAWLRSIQEFHMDDRGWADIGYNFAVDREGELFELRGWTRLGAHVAGHNTANVGIVLLGDATKASNVTEAAKRSLHWFTREADRRAGRQLTVRGHGELAATACPGRLQSWITRGMPLEPGDDDRPDPEPAAGKLVLAAKPILRRRSTRPGKGTQVYEETRRLQAELVYVHGLSEAVGAVDGWFGARTERGVRLLQQRKGARLVDGIPGPETWPLVLN